MRANFITFNRIAWLVGVALLVMIANIVASVLYMVIYSYFIDSGHDPHYYEAHIQAAAPYCSIVAGIPLMFLAGWWAGRRWQGEYALRSALVIWLAYAIVDIAMMLTASLEGRLAILVAVSLITKLAAVWLGASLAKSRRNL